MEVEAWIKPVNSRLRFCLCIVSFSLLTEEFFLLNHLIGSSTLRLFQAFRQWQVPLCTIRLINSCFLLPLAQIPAETRLSIHDSPFFAHEQDTVGTFSASPDSAGEVSCPPALSLFSPPPPPPTVPFLANHRCNKTYWRLTP